MKDILLKLLSKLHVFHLIKRRSKRKGGRRKRQNKTGASFYPLNQEVSHLLIQQTFLESLLCAGGVVSESTLQRLRLGGATSHLLRTCP